MTKDQFVQTMTTFIELEEAAEGVNKALQRLSPDFGGLVLERHEALILGLIKDAMGDNEGEWISYWLYELDHGKKYKDGMITSRSGKNVKLKTLSDLYEILTKEFI